MFYICSMNVPATAARLPAYAELHCLSNYSFLRGASHPEELVTRAHALGYAALALTDECSVAGAVRAHQAARALGLPLLIGSELQLADGPKLVLLASDRAAYGRLCRLITAGRRRSAKGEYRLLRADLADGLPGCLALLLPRHDLELADEQLAWFAATFAGRAWLAVERLRDGRDAGRLQRLAAAAGRHGLPLVAAGDVHMHVRGRRPLQDLLTAIRCNTPVAALGLALQANGERHLRRRDELAELYPPELLAETLRIAARCRFALDELSYQYPDDVTPRGLTPRAYLRQLTEQGAQRRWPDGCPPAVRRQLEHELALIAELGYEAYFLTVWDIVRYARAQGILCQGRGSAANSAVCYCLGITEVDPARMNLLFERFISRERGEPPDIDVDFEHERREEVIQYIYRKYGRERAALAATVITYRPKSALRDTAKALGLEPGQIEQLVAAVSGWRRWGGSGGAIAPQWLREAGFDPANPVLTRLLYLANQLLGFPRHLSQHVGGFVIARGPLHDLVPIENAAMPERTVIQWEKDDLEALGLLKVDVLGLGMLSAIRRVFDLINALRFEGRGTRSEEKKQPSAPSILDPRSSILGLDSVPAEDPAVYAMLQQADTVGVFQIESRAQMSMLPRLKPECFYDLVIEVAIVRPGPIQGDMVHPYLRRRQGLEPVRYPSAAVREVLARTLGVPLFQEQVIKLAQVAAGFTPGEADQLRRAMAAWRRRGGIEPYRRKLLEGMRERGYAPAFAERIYRQILGFGEYGFPESHAASFALLVYVSAWLKRYHPAAFCAALINSQPMGFYAPAQLVRDAREHGVEVRAVDVRYSEWDCTLEERGSRSEVRGKENAVPRSSNLDPRSCAAPALRLGLRLVSGLSQAAAERIATARALRPFQDVDDLARGARLDRGELKALAAADALVGLGGHRYRARWAVAGVVAEPPLLAGAGGAERDPGLAPPTPGQQVLADYAQLGLTLREHPLALLRPQLRQRRFLAAAEVALRPPGEVVRAAGLVLLRQRPGNGRAVFVTLEDETGSLNLLIWANLAERQRQVLLGAKLLGVRAEIQRAAGVQHLLCRHLEDHTPLLGGLDVRSRDFQ
jgi:error-prone DNA polymerase